MKRHQIRKPSRAKGQKRTKLVQSLDTALPSAGAQREGEAVRAAIVGAVLSAARRDYNETANPLHLLNGFIGATRAGVPVPDWVIRPMGAAIEKFLDGQGRITLEKAFGFRSNNGQRRRWTQAKQHEKDARFLWLIDRALKEGLPLTNDNKKAANKLSAIAKAVKILDLDPDKHDSHERTYYKLLKKHSSSLSRWTQEEQDAEDATSKRLIDVELHNGLSLRSAIENAAKILALHPDVNKEIDPIHYESFRQVWYERLKKHSSSLSE